MRNHDELTLDKLSEDERAEVFARFGADESLQLYGRGLRRRLPTMLDGDERAIRMVYSLVFSLPGTPVLFYGEEIGMAENLAIEGRYSVRAPMQWSPDGGFTTSESPRRPLVEGAYGPERVNVAAQRRDPDSLLNWFERLIRRRRECPELGFGELTLLDTGAPSVFAHRCDWEGETIVAVHELSGRPVRVSLPVDDGLALVDLFGPAEHALPAELDLEPYAAHWFRVKRAGRRLPALVSVAALEPLELAALALGRAGVAVHALRARHPHLGDAALALGAALLGLGVEQLRAGGRQPALRGALDRRLQPDHALR